MKAGCAHGSSGQRDVGCDLKAGCARGTRFTDRFPFCLEELSEDDLLSQYSLSFTKKTKKDNSGGHMSSNSEMLLPDLVDGTPKNSISTPPTTRNKFAAFLQRRNEASGTVVVPGTRSRYGCRVSVVFATLPILPSAVLITPERERV